ncbi:unnamed protein product [Amoebophrya sp. A25]|nr:unnamed protein product [Amoebophrya sp. A25]|eukprot:GSA25T00004883001.1
MSSSTDASPGKRRKGRWGSKVPENTNSGTAAAQSSTSVQERSRGPGWSQQFPTSEPVVDVEVGIGNEPVEDHDDENKIQVFASSSASASLRYQDASELQQIVRSDENKKVSSSSTSWSARVEAAASLPPPARPPPDGHYGFMGLRNSEKKVEREPEIVVLPKNLKATSSTNSCASWSSVEQVGPESTNPEYLTDFELHRLTAAQRRKKFENVDDGNCGAGQTSTSGTISGRSVAGSSAKKAKPSRDNFYNAYSSNKYQQEFKFAIHLQIAAFGCDPEEKTSVHDC